MDNYYVKDIIVQKMDNVDQIVELMDVYNVILFLLELVIYVEMDIELMQKELHVL